MERDKVRPSSFSFPSFLSFFPRMWRSVMVAVEVMCVRVCVCVRVSRQGPGKCEYGCGTLPTEHGSGEGGKERERKREKGRREEEEEEMKRRGEDSFLCSSLMKGGIGSSTPTHAFSLGDEP